ncbi:peptidoglycan DD-metalloendopeptidase family protein [bacterium]|nr:peptidoglycan DD-metalloendopeptidase family protein [bacterium]
MRRFFTKMLPVIVAVLVCIPVGLAIAKNEKKVDLQGRIKNIEKEIEKTRKELEKDEKKLKSIKQQKQNVLVELDHSEKKIEAVNRNLWTLQKEERFLKNEISEAEKQYETAMNRIKRHSDTYKTRLRSMYKRQQVSALEIFFSSGSFSSFLWDFKMLSILAEQDLFVLGELHAQQDTIRVSMDTIREALNAKVALASVTRREERDLSAVKKQRQALLSDIEKDLKLQEDVIIKRQNELEQSQAQIEKWRKEIAAQMKLEKMSESLKNYNFSSRKGKLPWPVSGMVVSSFGIAVDERTKTKTTNRGIEIRTKQGEPVRAIGRGKVAMTNFIRGYGNFILIYHPTDYYTLYGHLSDILVNKGDEVGEGAVIGSAGSTGLIDDREARLRLEILIGSKPDDPLAWLVPDSRRIAQ